VSQTVQNRADRRAARRGGESPGMQIEYDGRTYVVRQTDLTPRLVAELRKETGFAGWMGLLQEVRRGFDLDVCAAFIWLARRVAGEVVQFGEVLDSMTYDSPPRISVDKPETRRVGPADDAPEGETPEA